MYFYLSYLRKRYFPFHYIETTFLSFYSYTATVSSMNIKNSHIFCTCFISFTVITQLSFFSSTPSSLFIFVFYFFRLPNLPSLNFILFIVFALFSHFPHLLPSSPFSQHHHRLFSSLLSSVASFFSFPPFSPPSKHHCPSSSLSSSSSVASCCVSFSSNKFHCHLIASCQERSRFSILPTTAQRRRSRPR